MITKQQYVQYLISTPVNYSREVSVMAEEDVFKALDIVAKNQKNDTNLLGKLAQVSKATNESALEASARAMVEDPSIAQWVNDDATIKEFDSAALESDPWTAYHRSGKNVTPAKPFCDDDSEITVGQITARSLLFGRFLKINDPSNQVSYGPDNYVSCLGFTVDNLHALTGRKLLDVGCGDSIFPAEAKAMFDINVEGIDLNAVADLDAKKGVFKQYVKNLIFTKYIREVRRGMAPLGDHDVRLKVKSEQHIHNIHQNYLASSPKKGDATDLRKHYKDNEFDGVVSSWLLMYLDEEKATQALREMVRVTKNGGFIRICQGKWAQVGMDKGKGIGEKVTSKVQGITEVECKNIQAINPGGLRVFRVTKK